MNAAALVKANDDKVKAFDKAKLLTEADHDATNSSVQHITPKESTYK